MKKAGEFKHGGQKVQVPGVMNLNDLELDKNLSSRAQRIAAVSELVLGLKVDSPVDAAIPRMTHAAKTDEQRYQTARFIFVMVKLQQKLGVEQFKKEVTVIHRRVQIKAIPGGRHA